MCEKPSSVHYAVGHRLAHRAERCVLFRVSAGTRNRRYFYKHGHATSLRRLVWLPSVTNQNRIPELFDAVLIIEFRDVDV